MDRPPRHPLNHPAAYPPPEEPSYSTGAEFIADRGKPASAVNPET